MTTTPSGIIGLGDVDQLLTEINNELSVRPLMPTTVAGQVCWVRNGSEGVASIGKTSVFPVPFFAMNAIFWSLLMPNDRFSNSVRSPNDFDMFSTDK